MRITRSRGDAEEVFARRREDAKRSRPAAPAALRFPVGNCEIALSRTIPLRVFALSREHPLLLRASARPRDPFQASRAKGRAPAKRERLMSVVEAMRTCIMPGRVAAGAAK